ncbi:transglutaminase-like domain-containing protein [Kribbella sp. CA-294648]|uniref:transglutaminase-like domain-containing protein n=1 Tax=Kribbella sp. CA-294648 TaxID=3239948 RepID=UPI003D9469FB
MIDYSAPGPLTSLRADQVRLTERLPLDALGICKAVQSLVIQPYDAPAAGIPEERLAERNLRSAAALVDALIAVDPSSLEHPRTAERRVVGSCRHFATLATALLRLRGIPARARCGFGTYFVPGKNVDHWIVEYRSAESDRWVRVDVEHLDRDWPATLDDLQPGEFLTGGEAWQWYRTGAVSGDLFGVLGFDHAWGAGEIRANAIRDLAALNKLEFLPWDEWSRMEESFENKAVPEFDSLIDEIATTDNPEALYRTPALTAPAHLIN